MAARITDRGRGPEIEGTRVTVYRIMDFLREGISSDQVASELDLDHEQVNAAIAYINSHRQSVEEEYDKILQRVQGRNTPDVEAGRANSVGELKRRIRDRHKEDVTHADSGRQ